MSENETLQTPEKPYEFYMAYQLNDISKHIHKLNYQWWIDPATGERKERNVGEMLMLCVSELAEGMEGHRKGLKDDKLPQYDMLEVEIADCMIRLFDLAAGLGYKSIGHTLVEKLQFNKQRPDHKMEARLAEGGKKY